MMKGLYTSRLLTILTATFYASAIPSMSSYHAEHEHSLVNAAIQRRACFRPSTNGGEEEVPREAVPSSSDLRVPRALLDNGLTGLYIDYSTCSALLLPHLNAALASMHRLASSALLALKPELHANPLNPAAHFFGPPPINPLIHDRFIAAVNYSGAFSQSFLPLPSQPLPAGAESTKSIRISCWDEFRYCDPLPDPQAYNRPGVLAYVLRDNPRLIVVCPSFFGLRARLPRRCEGEMTVDGVNGIGAGTAGMTLLHEFMHAYTHSVVLDVDYGTSYCLQLAKTELAVSVYNADSYAWMAGWADALSIGLPYIRVKSGTARDEEWAGLDGMGCTQNVGFPPRANQFMSGEWVDSAIAFRPSEVIPPKT